MAKSISGALFTMDTEFPACCIEMGLSQIAEIA